MLFGVILLKNKCCLSILQCTAEQITCLAKQLSVVTLHITLVVTSLPFTFLVKSRSVISRDRLHANCVLSFICATVEITLLDCLMMRFNVSIFIIFIAYSLYINTSMDDQNL